MAKYTRKLVGAEEERAVSPVIGVILMVAITVILAAVIAAFVLDIGPGEADPGAAINHDQDDNEVTVELQSLDGSADAVVVVEDESGDFVDYNGGDTALTVSGQEETFDGESGNEADVAGGTIQAISVSDTDELDGEIDNIDDVDNNAILENLD